MINKKFLRVVLFIFLSFFNFINIAHANTYPYVKVQGRQLVADFTGNGNYQPYIIRGVGYSPTPIGRYSSDWGYYVSGANPNPNNLPNNMYADPNILNRDFLLLKQMNANTIRIWEGNDTLECGVSMVTFENAFPAQAPSYGDNIFTWLQQNNYLDADGLVIANLNSSTVLNALQAEFIDAGEYATILAVLRNAQSSDKNCGRFPNMLTLSTLVTANQNNLKVIAGFWVGAFGYFNCSTTPCSYALNTYNAESNDPGLDAPFDLTNSYIRNDILTRFKNYVTSFKNRPEILFWAIGNENNLSLDPNDTSQIQAWYSLVNQMAAAAHQIEGANYHPVAVVNGDLGFIGDATLGADDASLSNVDIWGTNTYRGRSFEDYFIQYKALSSKPLWISEYGIDAWNSCNTSNPSACDPNNPSGGSEDQADQSSWDGGLWDEVAGNGDISIGATVTEYSDEWWKPDDWICTYYPYTTYALPVGDATYCHWNHFYFGEGPGSSWPLNAAAYSAPSPDNYANEAWWGLMKISNSSPETQADAMTPRLVYTTLQGKFSNAMNNAGLASYLILPVNNGVSLNSTSATFSWSLGRGVAQYELFIGSTFGGSDIYSYSGTATSTTVTGIPLTGHTLYVQLGSYINGAWQINNYTYLTINNAITASAGTGGTIDPSGFVSVDYGDDQSFTIIPDDGYNINQVMVDGSAVILSDDDSYTFSDVTQAHTISVSFMPVANDVTTSPGTTVSATDSLSAESANYASDQVFTITPSAGSGGAISPSDDTSVNLGASQTFSITPDTGYSIDQVLVDGAAVTLSGNNSYTFNNVTAGHTISASFKPVSYTISASASRGGTVSPSGDVSVSYGSYRTFSIIPNAGYDINVVLVDGKEAELSSNNTYTFNDVSQLHTITASFTPITYEITVNAGSGGTINPPDDVNVGYGVSQTFSFIPDAGYSIGEVFVDGNAVILTTSNTYTISDITSDHSVTASFVPITYTITVNASKGGAIIPSGDISLHSGEAQVFKIVPNTGYVINKVLVDGKAVLLSPKNTYTFDNVSAPHAIKANFIAVK